MTSLKLILLAVGLGVGGTEAHILELASRIDRKRFDVMVCSLKPDDRIAAELRARGVRVISLGGAGKLDARVLFRLWKLFRREQPDIVHAFLIWANVTARLLGRVLRGIHIISSYHDEMVSEGWLIRTIDRLTIQWTDAIVCCSEAVRRSVFSQIGGKESQYVTIPFGLDMVPFTDTDTAMKSELGLKEGVPVIGIVCRLVEPKKGLRVLLQAMAYMKKRGVRPECQLLIVGDGPAYQELRALSEQLEIAQWVVFAGMRRDIPRLLPLMQLFVLPSLYEGFGIAILEAMAASRAVVATAVGGIPEFVTHGETGLLVPPGDPIALAAAIESLLTNPEQAAQMGAKGRTRARDKFGIASVVRRHEDVYSACVCGAA